MAIGDDFSVDHATGAIRHTSGATTYTVLELHRWLSGLADDAAAAGDDLVDITSLTPSERSTDNIVALQGLYNIDDDAAEYFYDGSISQGGGDTLYSGLVVVGAVESGTELQIVQNNAILTSYWSTGLNADATQSILLRILVKSRTGGADIDGKRIRVFARELGDTYDEFTATLGEGNSTAAISTEADLNNATAAGTIATWSSIVNTEGYQQLDVDADTTDEDYYSEWDKGSQSIADLYERAKWITRRGTSETIHGINGALFRGITHQVAYTTESGGPFQEDETLSWGSGTTAGTGLLLALDDNGTTGTFWIQLLTGVAPSANTITGGTSSATATASTVTARTVPKKCFLGTYTGSAIIGAYGIGIQPADLSSSDQVFDLTNTQISPPNNATFTVSGLVSTEDRVLVGPEDGAGGLDVDQFALDTTLSGATETAVVVGATIPTDTPATGTIRIQLDDGTYRRIAYTSYTAATFTIGSTDFSTTNATASNNVFISYIDELASGTTASFTSIYASDRTLFVRVRDGGGTPIKTFETTGTLSSSGGSVTAIRTSDA